VGKRYFPAPEDLPVVRQMEHPGLFRFGRPLLDDEKITHRERDVLKRFEGALAEVKVAYATLGKQIRLVPPHQEA
jgi:hypothetical protein